MPETFAATKEELMRQAQDEMRVHLAESQLSPKRSEANFSYYARRALARHPGAITS